MKQKNSNEIESVVYNCTSCHRDFKRNRPAREGWVKHLVCPSCKLAVLRQGQKRWYKKNQKRLTAGARRYHRAQQRQTRVNAARKHGRWHEFENTFLLENVGKIPTKEIAFNLNRTFYSVRTQLHKLKKRAIEKLTME